PQWNPHNEKVKIVALLLMSAAVLPAADLFDRFFDGYYFRYNPTAATSAGFHQYDSQLEDYSKKAVQERIGALRRFAVEFGKLGQSPERDLVLGSVRSTLLELESIRMWEKSPDLYSSGITSSVFGIMSRNFAPPEQRLRSVISRERQMPAVFASARENLNNPPPVYTAVAI